MHRAAMYKMASPHKGTHNVLKVLIIGKAGSGKSTLGNLILGKNAFGTQAGMKIKTEGHQTESTYFPEFGCHIRVVDTPGIECFSHSQRAERENIDMWKAATDQDPDAILYTVRCKDTYEGPTHEKYKRIKTIWGQGFCENLIVAFTFGDRRVNALPSDIANAGPHLQEVLADADQRYLVFSNKFAPKEQVKNLVEKMKQMRQSSASGAAPLLTPSRMDTSHPHDERKLSVVIIGRTGTGKTKLGSVIVGQQLISKPFDPTITTGKIGSTNITVVDTPDIIEKSSLDQQRQVSKWKELSGSEPDVILLAVRFDKKYSERDLQLYKMVMKIWGQDDFKRRLAVVFTFVDKMQEDILGKLGPEFEEVWKDVNQRYVFFDEKSTELGKHIVHFMVRIIESLSSVGAAAMPSRDVAMNAIGTTIPTHGHSGHSTMDEFLAVQSPSAAAMPSRDVAMNALGTTRTHGHSGHSTMDEFLAVQSPSAAAMPSRDVAMNALGTTRTHGHSGHSTMDEFLAVQSPRKDLSILVIGKAGTGKSSLANAILQTREFKVAVGMTIQTKTAAKGSVCLGDLNVKVVDTPDITTLSGEISKQAEFKKWSDLTSPGPDVILLTVRCDSKYTPEDFAMYKELQMLGMRSVLEQKLLVVFTWGDQRQPDFEGDVQRAGSNLHAMMKDARGRRLVYNDKEASSEKAAFVRDLLRMVSSIQTPSSLGEFKSLPPTTTGEMFSLLRGEK